MGSEREMGRTEAMFRAALSSRSRSSSHPGHVVLRTVPRCPANSSSQRIRSYLIRSCDMTTRARLDSSRMTIFMGAMVP